jgi:hypothetical protein
MTWYLITSDHPAIGAQVPVWHPGYGSLVVTRTLDGFVEMRDGEQRVVVGPLHWWHESPQSLTAASLAILGRPPGEKEPSREEWMKALERAQRSFSQIGFSLRPGH